MDTVITNRLENKKEELQKLQAAFDIFYTREMKMSTFEQNAIFQLLVIKELKAEIAELELLQQIAALKK